MYTTERERADAAHKVTIERIKVKAAWVITNVAVLMTLCTTLVAQYGAIEAFVYLLKNTSSFEAADQDVWAWETSLTSARRCATASWTTVCCGT